MKKLSIEWKHLEVDGETCNRCYDTGENLTNEIKRLNRSLNPKGIEIILEETILDCDEVHHSNELFFNGKPIEEILDIWIEESYCESCSDLVNADTYCRTVFYEDTEYEEVPAKAIRHAVYKVLGIEKDSPAKPEKSCCCGNNGCCN